MSFGDLSILGAMPPLFPGIGIPSKAGLLARGSHRSHPRKPGPSWAGPQHSVSPTNRAQVKLLLPTQIPTAHSHYNSGVPSLEPGSW